MDPLKNVKKKNRNKISSTNIVRTVILFFFFLTCHVISGGVVNMEESS